MEVSNRCWLSNWVGCHQSHFSRLVTPWPRFPLRLPWTFAHLGRVFQL